MRRTMPRKESCSDLPHTTDRDSDCAAYTITTLTISVLSLAGNVRRVRQIPGTPVACLIADWTLRHDAISRIRPSFRRVVRTFLTHNRGFICELLLLIFDLFDKSRELRRDAGRVYSVELSHQVGPINQINGSIQSKR